VAAMLVTVAASPTPTDAQQTWLATKSQARTLMRRAARLYADKLTKYRAEGQWGRTLFARAVARDQAWRTVLEEVKGNAVTVGAVRSIIWPRICASDRSNGIWLLRYLRTHTWPARTVVGEKIAGAAWLLAQHADTYPAFQRHALSRMAPLLANRDVDPSSYANLFDRVAIADGRPQRYGTQIDFDRRRRCIVKPTLEDENGIDRFRQQVGLRQLHVELQDVARTADAKLCD
jgi:hypothetical protein